MNIKTTLKQLGLTDRHATIYLSCLELGSATIGQISNKSGFARSTCEAVLESLQKKGFVSSFKSKTIKRFTPEDPKTLVRMQEEKLKLLEDTLPQFNARYFKGNVMPGVRLYQGEAGVKNVLKEILNEATELKSFGSIDDIYDAFGDYFKKFTKERIKKKIPLKVILKDTPLAHKRKDLGLQELREVKILPKNHEYSSVTFIWNDKIAMFSLKESVVAFVIESNELSSIQKTMFEFMWENLS